MRPINSKLARTCARLGQRGAIFGLALPEIAKERDDVVVLTADLGLLSGLDRFKTAFPGSFFNVGIAEQNMIGIAAGFANEGNLVFATTYATFITMRSFEQIRHHLGYQRQNVRIVGATAGLSMGMSGNTHYAIEDIALMRAIPNMVVLSPADSLEAYRMVFETADYKGPLYIRLTGLLDTPCVYLDEYTYKLGKSISLLRGEDVEIFATGTMVATALEAAGSLRDSGISCGVTNIHTIKPLDECAIVNAQDRRLIVTVEEHSVVGGLGGAVAECAAKLGMMPPLLRVGIDDTFFKADEYERLLERSGLTARGIHTAVTNALLK